VAGTPAVGLGEHKPPREVANWSRPTDLGLTGNCSATARR